MGVESNSDPDPSPHAAISVMEARPRLYDESERMGIPLGPG